MFSTVDLERINEIVEARHANPHDILGLHEICLSDGKKALSIRVFVPGAKNVTLLDDSDDTKRFELEKIHMSGFFETIIKRRKKWFKYRLLFEDFDGNSWEAYDPYSFLPMISDMDRHLFGEGTHYKIFDKLGAHCLVNNGVSGVLFAVWAPNAKRVSVIGNFNNWDGRRNTMRLLEKSGIWELFIPQLENNEHYKFEILDANGILLQKTDPFSSFNELRPSSSSLVFDIEGYDWKDQVWFSEQKKKNILNSPVNIYEVHLGSWKRMPEEDRFLSYLELADDLIPYVVKMGYTHIELLPVTEHPYDGSWGYQVTGYFAPTSRFGNPHEFMQFIDRCHQANIGVIMDWVPAHFPKDAHGLAGFDGTALFEHEDPKKGEHPEWGTLVFNFGRKEVKNFLIASALFWLEKYHIDGLRVDAVASLIYLDYAKSSGEWLPNQYGGRENIEAIEFIKHMNSVIIGAFPERLLIAEESTTYTGVTEKVENGGLGFTFKWNMGWMNDFLSYISKTPVHRRFHHNNLTFGMMYHFSEKYVLVLSHDEVVHGKKSLINKMDGDIWQKCANLRVSLGFSFGHPGKKLIFMGGEFGQFIEWNEKISLDWFLLEYPHHAQILKFTEDLNQLYKSEAAFWEKDYDSDGFCWVDCNDHARSIISFVRRSNDPYGDLLFICNFTPLAYENFRIGVESAGTYDEILNSDAEKYGGSGVVNTNIKKSDKIECNGRQYSVGLRLPPLGVVILKRKA